MQNLEPRAEAPSAEAVPTPGTTLIVEPGAASPAMGGVLNELGVTLAFKAISADTSGQWSLLEYTAPPSFRGVPPHWHKQTTEAFYVLEGRLAFDLEEGTVEVSPGGFVSLPPGTVHGWRSPDPVPAKFLVLYSPAGFEAYMRELIASVKAEPVWPPQDMAKYFALGEKHDTFQPPVPK